MSVPLKTFLQNISRFLFFTVKNKILLIPIPILKENEK